MKRLANARPKRVGTARKTRHGARHAINPPGSKTIRRFYKAKHGTDVSVEKAAAWYADYLSEHDRKVREREAARKLSRRAA